MASVHDREHTLPYCLNLIVFPWCSWDSLNIHRSGYWRIVVIRQPFARIVMHSLLLLMKSNNFTIWMNGNPIAMHTKSTSCLIIHDVLAVVRMYLSLFHSVSFTTVALIYRFIMVTCNVKCFLFSFFSILSYTHTLFEILFLSVDFAHQGESLIVYGFSYWFFAWNFSNWREGKMHTQSYNFCVKFGIKFQLIDRWNWRKSM